MPLPAKPLTFRLRYNVAWYDVTLKKEGESLNPAINRYEFERREELDKQIPAVPLGFQQLTGDHPTVVARADALNLAQWTTGKMRYFFYPEVIEDSGGWVATHCDVCKRRADERAAGGAV
jgi:hypothetical protein